MKRKIIFNNLKVISLFAFIFIGSNIWSQQMNGPYTIGTSGNYISFFAAISDLQSRGVDGPVTFNVLSETFNEQISIPEITGASVTNTITFRSQTGTNTDVILQHSPSVDNWVIRLNGADFIHFYNMTISNTNSGLPMGHIIVFDNRISATSNNIIQGNIINGINTTSMDENLACISQSLFPSANATEFTQISSNKFNYGSISVSLFDNSVGNEVGNVIEGNTMDNFAYFGIHILNNENITIKGNTLNGRATSATSQTGMRLKNLKNNSIIENNVVNCSSSISNTGIDLLNTNTTGTSPVVVKNNMVSLSTGSGSNIGIYIESGSKFIDAYYNSVNITSGAPATSSAFEINTPVAGGNFKIENNIFVNSNGGPAIKLPNPSQVTSCNFNDLYVTGTTLGVYDGIQQARLINWRTATTFDINSVSLYAPFTNSVNLHLITQRAMLKAANPISGTTTDIDGQSRNAAFPNMGAHENQCTPLAGNSYTIDWQVAPSATNFQTFNAAIDKLNSCGISGPVVFKVAGPHAYDEQITIPQIFGSSNTNTITFQSQSGLNTDVTINNSPSTNNWIVKLDASSYITFKDMTMINSSLSSFGTVVNLINGASFNTFQNCILNGKTITSTSADYSVIYNAGTIPNNNIIIQNCKINNGSYGIYFHVPVLYSKFSLISNNIIQNYHYTGIYLQTQEAMEVTGNTISGKGLNTDEYGISCNDLLNKCKFLKNNIKVGGLSNTRGIILANSNGAAGNEILVANNQIAIIKGTNGFGIVLNLTTYFNIYNNTSVIDQSATATSAALYLHTLVNTSSNIKNNILANFKGGTAIRFEFSDATWTNSNFNDLYTSGTNVGFFNATPYALLADWQAIGTDAKSISLPPIFENVSSLDFRLKPSSPCVNQGDPLTNITEFNTDIANANRIMLCRIDIGCFESATMVRPAYENIWLGCASDDWSNPSNWSKASVPVNSDKILIPGYTPNQPTVKIDAECKSIDINVDNGAKVTIEAGKILKVN